MSKIRVVKATPASLARAERYSRSSSATRARDHASEQVYSVRSLPVGYANFLTVMANLPEKAKVIVAELDEKRQKGYTFDRFFADLHRKAKGTLNLASV